VTHGALCNEVNRVPGGKLPPNRTNLRCQPGGDLRYVVFTLGDVEQERVVRFVIPRKLVAVQLQKRLDSAHRGAFVAIGEQVMVGNGMQQRRRLIDQRGELHLAKQDHRGPTDGVLQQVHIPHKGMPFGHFVIKILNHYRLKAIDLSCD
jgi:hypothetical protein